MSPRDARWPGADRGKGDRLTSVVGSKLSEISNTAKSKVLPRGGIREQDGLTVAEGVLPETTFIGKSGRRGTGRNVLRIIAIVSGTLAALFVLVALAFAIVGQTSAFTIANVQAYDSEHITASDIVQLANVRPDATLINVDTSVIEKNVQRNPWVASVDVEKVLPDTLRLSVRERVPRALVAMGANGTAWLLGEDMVWIEPLPIESKVSESFNDSALSVAQQAGLTLVCDVPSSVTPVAGQVATDACMETVRWFADQLSDSFRNQIVSYSASSEDDISCVLANGVEVSFGSAGNVSTKESVALRVLDQYEGQVTYINVRVPTHTTYRRVNSDYVREGTGATGTSVEEKSVVEKERAYVEDEKSKSGSGTEPDGAVEGDSTADGEGFGSETSGDEWSYDSYGTDYSGEYGYESDDSYYAYEY